MKKARLKPPGKKPDGRDRGPAANIAAGLNRKFKPYPLAGKYNEKVPIPCSDALSFGIPISAEPDYTPQNTPLYAISWGLNANGRAGNKAAAQIELPRQVQLSYRKKYISCAAGKHHSALVTDEGIMYTFGDGRKNQLGYGENLNPNRRRGIVQSIPNQVNPSGIIKFGRDLKISQVTAGSFFTIGRECSVEEGVDILRGLRKMETHLKELLKIYPDSENLQRSWAIVRQERYIMARISEGQLVAWGTGKYGELGLGPFKTSLSSPQLISKLANVCITQVSAGQHHVLALSNDAILYSWGRGSSGQLGHNDVKNRYNPEKVKFYDPYYVEYVAAGDNHSAVLFTTRKGLPRANQLRRVSCFGRGGHGRLGNNSVFSASSPVVVEKFPPSANGTFYRQVKCGGAHTLLLAEKTVPKTLANPWGKRTFVLAWGYGTNGQLGNGDLADSFIPVKARIMKWDIIAEISAGRSWSMARTIGGELFTWGKGWRGQLGQGKKVKFSIVPRKVDTFASFLQMSSNFSHNVCISVPRKHLNAKIAVQAASQPDIFQPLQTSTLKTRENASQYKIHCCRRLSSDLRKSSNIRYICRTCNLSSVCYDCVKLCHRGHVIHIRSLHKNVSDAEKLAEIESEKIRSITNVNLNWFESLKSIKSLRASTSAAQIRRVKDMAKGKVKPVRKKKKKNKFTEMLYQTRIWSRRKKKKRDKDSNEKVVHNDDDDDEDYAVDIDEHKYLSLQPICRCGLYNSKCRQLPVLQEATDELPDEEHIINRTAAIKIQKLARNYLGKKQIKKMMRYIKDIRYEVSKKHFLEKILEPVLNKVKRALDAHKEVREHQQMIIEETLRKKYDYQLGLQMSLGSMDAMLFGTRLLYGRGSTQLPRIRMWSAEVSEEIRPSFCFSTVSIREKQLNLHFTRRHNVADLAILTRQVPRVDKTEGKYFDTDVSLFTEKFLEERRLVLWRKSYYEGLRLLEAKKEAEIEKLRSEKAALMNARKDAVKKVKALKAPAPPPPAKLHPSVQKLIKERKKEAERLEFLDKIKEQEDKEDVPFNMFSKKEFVPVKRRHSIGDPAAIYSRLKEMRSNILLKGYSKRRDSLPIRIESLRSLVTTRHKFLEQIQKSLSLYKQRHKTLYEYLDPEMEKIWEVNMDMKRKGMRKVMAMPWLNPRLPGEFLAVINENERRRTIGAPERLAAQIHIMIETRNCFSKLRLKSRRIDKITYRRRSFDMGETRDAVDSINDTLGYEFEEKWKLATLQELYHAAAVMTSKMITKGYIEGGDDASVSNVSISTMGFDSVADEAKASYAPGKMPKVQGKANSGKYGKGGETARGATAAGGNRNVWQEHYTQDGATYYYNVATGTSSWEYPAGGAVEICSQHQDDQGNWYWYNNTTGETEWVQQ